MTSDPHFLPDPQFDWERLQVKKFCSKLAHQFSWDKCCELYIETFVKDGWSFQKFKETAEYDGIWNDKMFALEKLHLLSTFA